MQLPCLSCPWAVTGHHGSYGRGTDSNYYSLPLGRMARTEATHNLERRPRRTDGRGERRTVAETVGRKGRREELGNLVVTRWGTSMRWAHA
jgi:hypothetical protein